MRVTMKVVSILSQLNKPLEKVVEALFISYPQKKGLSKEKGSIKSAQHSNKLTLLLSSTAFDHGQEQLEQLQQHQRHQRHQRLC